MWETLIIILKNWILHIPIDESLVKIPNDSYDILHDYFFANNNNYVFYLDFAESITDEYAKIGEVIDRSEPIYTEEMAKYIQNHEGVVIK